MLPAPPKPSPRRWRRSAQYSTEVRTIATGSWLPSPVWSGPKHGSLPVCEYEPTPPSTFPPSPPRPSSATACRKEEAVAGVAGALPSSVAGKQHSTAPQLHSCTAAPACRNILAGKTCLCPLTLTAKRSSSFPSSASLTLYSSFPSRSPNPFPTRLRPSPSQLQHSHPFHRVEQAARSSSTPIWTFFPNTLSAVTRALDAHRRGPHSRGENGRAFGSLLRLSGL